MSPFLVIDPQRPGVPPDAGTCAVGIMAKVPRSGRVKTRLVPPLSHDQASALSCCFLRDVADAIAAAARAHPAPVQGLAVYLPKGEEPGFEGVLPGDFLLLQQRGEGLGERLLHGTEDLLSVGYESVCLVNSDSPTLPSSIIREAAALLRASGDRVVLGPAVDGGYYLIGLKRGHRRLFEDISWSTPSVLAQTLERARELSLEVHLLPEWYDVDDQESLRLLCRELLQVDARASGRGASTRALLDALLPQLESFRYE
jgi:rSAM/selenodomain-associated transferase 1